MAVAKAKTAVIAVEVEKRELVAALRKAKPFADLKSPIDAVQAVRIVRGPDDLFMDATNFQCAARIHFGGIAKGKFDVLVPIRELEQALKAMAADVTVQMIQEKDHVELRVLGHKRAKKLSCPDRANWPDYGDFEQPKGGKCAWHGKGAALGIAAEYAAPFASKDDTRPHLHYALLDATEDRPVLVATDSYVLFVSDCPPLPKSQRVKGGAKGAVGVHARLLAHATKGMTEDDGAALYDCDDHSLLFVTHAEYRFAKSKGYYPKWRGLFTEDEPKLVVEVDRDELYAVAYDCAEAQRKNRPMRVTVWGDRIQVMMLGDEGDPEMSGTIGCEVKTKGYADAVALAEKYEGHTWKSKRGAEAVAAKLDQRFEPEVVAASTKRVEEKVKGVKGAKRIKTVTETWRVRLNVPFRIGFNPHYMKDLANRLDGGDGSGITLEFWSPLRSTVLTAGRDRAILMPIRIEI